jgi:DNA-binding NtrC family response regulator
MAPCFTSTCRSGNRSCSEIAILFVDDDPAYRAGLAGLLRDDRHEVLEFAHPGLLPPWKDLAHVRVLVTDYEMPHQDGFQLAGAFHASHPDHPVVMVTALYIELVEAEAARRPFLHLRFKTIDYDELHALIHQLAA